MNDIRKQKLIELGVDALADALLDLAIHFREADDLIEQMLSTPNKNIQLFKQKLSKLQHSRRFIDWRGSTRFSRELSMMLQGVKSSVDDPLTGMELVATFYEADKTIFEMCDDSSGEIGDVFRIDAKELFLHYASRYPEKQKIADIILRVIQKDDYGIRDTLIDCAGECLPEPVIRTMIGTLETWADEAKKEYYKRDHLRSIESLARQIKDANLFKKTRIASVGALNSAAILDISRVYLENGDVETAHSWIKKISEGETFQAYERDKLLIEIYQKQGDSEKLAELLFQKFRSHHSIKNLEALLDVIGHDKKDEVLADEVEQILKSKRMLESDAKFLVEVGKMDEVEAYLLNRADQLEEAYYDSLLSLAKVMEAEKRYLVTSLIFRGLLVSILKRGYTKAYPYGISYLRKLDTLAVRVSDWKG